MNVVFLKLDGNYALLFVLLFARKAFVSTKRFKLQINFEKN